MVPQAPAEDTGVRAGTADHPRRDVVPCSDSRRLAELDAVTTPATEPVFARPVSAVSPLETERLAVRWPGAAEPAVREVDLVVGARQRLVLTGASGSGKSTVLAALMRHLDPAVGQIRLGGTDTLRLAGDDVRTQLAWCGPASHLFDSTLRENLLLARPGADDDQLLAALRTAQLGDWMAALPSGLDTPLGAHGSPVSGGERQRLGVARAVLADRPFLLLDEPTAHLDAATSATLARDLLALTDNRGAVIVTHRPGEFAELPTLELPPTRTASGGTVPVGAGAPVAP